MYLKCFKHRIKKEKVTDLLWIAYKSSYCREIATLMTNVLVFLLLSNLPILAHIKEIQLTANIIVRRPDLWY